MNSWNGKGGFSLFLFFFFFRSIVSSISIYTDLNRFNSIIILDYFHLSIGNVCSKFDIFFSSYRIFFFDKICK